MGFMLNLLIALLAASITAANTSTPEATPYLSDLAEQHQVVPLDWDCEYGSWRTVARYCATTFLCSNGCEVRYLTQRRSFSCQPTHGNPVEGEETRDYASGCCTGGIGGQCISPTQVMDEEDQSHD